MPDPVQQTTDGRADIRGWWEVRITGGCLIVESNDVTHDIRLYIDGEFRNAADQMACASEIARRLNEGRSA